MGRGWTPEPRPRAQPAPAIKAADYRAPDFDLPALSAFAIYIALSIIFFGRRLFGHLSTAQIGAGTDPSLMMWFLAWWPHAIAHGLNPFLTRAIWAPSGTNLAWQTSIPLASIIASPLTEKLGPLASYNILCLLSLPLDAWCIFILCRYISRSCWASLLGGYIFGFSAFMLGQLSAGHLHMLLVFPVPLAVYLVVHQLAGGMTNRIFVSRLALLLIAQFLFSIEIFATMTMFGAMTLFLSWSSGTARLKERILALLQPIACSYGIVLVLMSPFLYYLLAFGFKHKPFFSPTFYSADFLNFLIPTRTNEFGRIVLFEPLSKWFFHGWLAESGAYISPPLIIIISVYAAHHWREPLGNLLLKSLIVTVVLSLGPFLHIASHEFPIALPWLPFVHLPIVDNALPVRFSMYAFLILALIASLWFASAEARPAVRFVFAVAVLVFNMPNLSSSLWSTAVNTPAFFRADLYRDYLRKGETVVILPYAGKGYSMLWQASTDMYFNMAEGSGAGWPDAFLRWPIAPALADQSYVPDASSQLKAFLAAHDVSTVIAVDEELTTWQKLLSTFDTAPVKVGGVSLYRLTEPAQHQVEATLYEMRSQFDTARITALVAIANKYLSSGASLGSLSVLKAEELNLIPQESLIGPPPEFAMRTASAQSVPLTPYSRNLITDSRFAYGVWLGEASDGRVSVAEQAWYPAIVPLLEKLCNVGSGIYFPYPNKLEAISSPPEEQDGWLLITFTREQLGRADKLLKDYSLPRAQLPTGHPED
jgi:hypothetical protein